MLVRTKAQRWQEGSNKVDKLVIEPLEPKLSKYNLVRISDKAMREVQKVQIQISQTASYIVGKMIAFAMEHFEIAPKQ